MSIKDIYSEAGASPDEAAASLLDRWGVSEDESGDSPVNPKAPQPEGTQEEPSVKDERSQEHEDGDETESEDSDSDSDSEASDDSEASSDSDDNEADVPAQADDNAQVVVEVNGEQTTFTVAELKRLAGQEAALTKKSQAVAELRKKYEEGLGTQHAALQEMVTRASKRFEPYKDFDFALAAQQYDPDTYQALRDDARSAYADLEFFQNELQGLNQRVAKERAQQLQEQAAETLKALADPEKGIPGFNREVFRQMYDFAVGFGLPGESLAQLVNPAAWKLIHTAMKADEVAKVKKEARPATQKVHHKVKTSRTKGKGDAPHNRFSAETLDKIRSSSGLTSIESAADALVARWGS